MLGVERLLIGMMMGFVWLFTVGLAKLFGFIIKTGYDGVKAEQQYRKAYGPEPSTGAMSTVPTDLTRPLDEIYLRVAMNVETGREIKRGMFDTRQYTVVHATFDFSPHALKEIKRKGLEHYAFIYSEPVIDSDEKVWAEEMKDGKMPTWITHIIQRPRQQFFFSSYKDAIDGMEEIKKNLSILKGVVEHGTDKPLATTFEA